jgi:hypothetical protein
MKTKGRPRHVDIYDIPAKEPDRWFPGDIHLRKFIRKVLSPWRKRPPSGLSKVATNLSLGLTRLGISNRVHRRPSEPRPGALVAVTHAPVEAARQIAARHRCVIGPGVLQVPDEWPDMFTNSRAICYIQACDWQADVFRRLYGPRVAVWPVGIDTEDARPMSTDPKTHDFLVYDKRRWAEAPLTQELMEPLLRELDRRKLTYRYLRYGNYPRAGAKGDRLLHEWARECRAMLFVCENETQGIAYNEVLSLGLPILAWDHGWWQDPARIKYGLGEVPATSVPYWDERCGEIFHTVDEFPAKLDLFLDTQRTGRYRPRDYVVENLGLEMMAKAYLRLFEGAPTASTPPARSV